MVNNGENSRQFFLGEYQPNVTVGARIALPKKIREVIGENRVVLSRGFEKCIFGYTKQTWQEESEKTLISPISDKKARMLKRYVFSGAYELTMDSQGRVVLPKTLLEYSDLKDDCAAVIIGAGDHFEIWNKDYWVSTFDRIEQEVLK